MAGNVDLACDNCAAAYPGARSDGHSFTNDGAVDVTVSADTRVLENDGVSDTCSYINSYSSREYGARSQCRAAMEYRSLAHIGGLFDNCLVVGAYQLGGVL